ncbi:TetR/AcrR family transcriptional regulator [Geomicrobium sp. JCM 19038]|uniref:TetR/AcrR family transcriptional regulator n=1 Tax=Geomicrobium sp. JCM 19038 TaxID=1460635 RepID=UPI00045F22EE|nr:TetR/AcrR family transcriptional regulator [Geomicrobium sp. JCM 19038]GAK10223.1 transcriptional regulator, TetR family [Geomicrobium sp. JCM 19038]
MDKARQRIMKAAEQLFVQKGFNHVSVREVASRAKCSHTSIYVYFKDKHALLEAIAEKPLATLHASLVEANDLYELAERFVTFGLIHRNLYPLIMTTEAQRLDEGINHELNEWRLMLFTELKEKILAENDQSCSMDVARMVFYQLHGMIMTYVTSEETVEELLERLRPLLRHSVRRLCEGEGT